MEYSYIHIISQITTILGPTHFKIMIPNFGTQSFPKNLNLQYFFYDKT